MHMGRSVGRLPSRAPSPILQRPTQKVLVLYFDTIPGNPRLRGLIGGSRGVAVAVGLGLDSMKLINEWLVPKAWVVSLFFVYYY